MCRTAVPRRAVPAQLRLALAAALALAGCGGTEPPPGKAAPYHDNPRPVAVVMPPAAPAISQQFAPAEGDFPGHLGLDIRAARGTPVLAAAPGRVIAAFREPQYGLQLILSHGPDEDGREMRTVYRHLEAVHVGVGDRVRRGERIAAMGDSGIFAPHVHLHFEVLRASGKGAFEPHDPQLYWADGVGRVTCPERRRPIPARPFRITYPVPCAGR